MKSSLLALLLITFLSASAQEKKFVLKGSVPVSTKKYNALLSWDNGGNGEEVKVINGKFTINGTLSNPGIATLSLQEADPKPGKEFSRLAYEQNTEELFMVLDAWQNLKLMQLSYVDQLMELISLQTQYENQLEIK